MVKICLIEDCKQVVHAHGLCHRHYVRKWKWGDPLAVLKTPGGGVWVKPLIWSRDSETGCWNVISHKAGEGGYPRVRRNNKLFRVNRYIFELVKGNIPPGMCVLHTCDNRICMNPEHLFLGTRTDNHRDMVNKGRNVTWRTNSWTKLSDIDVERVKKLRGVKTQRQIAKDFGVSTSLVCSIQKGRCRKQTVE